MVLVLQVVKKMIVLNVVFDMIVVVVQSVAVAQVIEQVVIILKNTRYKCIRQIVVLLRELSHWKRAANELPLFPFVSPPAHPSVLTPRSHHY